MAKFLRAIDQGASKVGRLIAANPLAISSAISGATIALYPDLTLGTLLQPLGFTADGVAAGSLAASAQSALGNVGAGGIFAFCQSAASGGSATSTVAASAGAAVATAFRVVAAMRKESANQEEEEEQEEEPANVDYEAEFRRERSASPSPPAQAAAASRTEGRGGWGPGGHSPIFIDHSKVCWLCRLRWGPECPDLPKTTWACERCDTPLCLSGERNCFREFHDH